MDFTVQELGKGIAVVRGAGPARSKSANRASHQAVPFGLRGLIEIRTRSARAKSRARSQACGRSVNLSGLTVQ